MLTGDNQATAEAIAQQAGIDEVFANCSTRQGQAGHALQAEGRKVAMLVMAPRRPALAQADDGICDWHVTDIAIASSTRSISGTNGGNPGDPPLPQTIATIKQNLFWAFINNVY
jgi:Cu+-exporting ATPase